MVGAFPTCTFRSRARLGSHGAANVRTNRRRARHGQLGNSGRSNSGYTRPRSLRGCMLPSKDGPRVIARVEKTHLLPTPLVCRCRTRGMGRRRGAHRRGCRQRNTSVASTQRDDAPIRRSTARRICMRRRNTSAAPSTVDCATFFLPGHVPRHGPRDPASQRRPVPPAHPHYTRTSRATRDAPPRGTNPWTPTKHLR